MSKLLDTTGARIGYLAYDLTAGESSDPIVVRVKGAEASLLSEQSDDVVIKARENGTSDPYVDLATSPIDLSGYTPGSNIDFDLIVEASEDVDGLARAAVFLGVTTSGPAGWSA